MTRFKTELIRNEYSRMEQRLPMELLSMKRYSFIHSFIHSFITCGLLIICVCLFLLLHELDMSFRRRLRPSRMTCLPGTNAWRTRALNSSIRPRGLLPLLFFALSLVYL